MSEPRGKVQYIINSGVSLTTVDVMAVIGVWKSLTVCQMSVFNLPDASPHLEAFLKSSS